MSRSQGGHITWLPLCYLHNCSFELWQNRMERSFVCVYLFPAETDITVKPGYRPQSGSWIQTPIRPQSGSTGASRAHWKRCCLSHTKMIWHLFNELICSQPTRSAPFVIRCYLMLLGRRQPLKSSGNLRRVGGDDFVDQGREVWVEWVVNALHSQARIVLHVTPATTSGSPFKKC